MMALRPRNQIWRPLSTAGAGGTGAGAPPGCASPILYLGGARRRNGCIGAGISVVESVRLLDEGAACPETTTTTQIAGRAWRGGRDWPPAALVAAAECRRKAAKGAG